MKRTLLALLALPVPALAADSLDALVAPSDRINVSGWIEASATLTPTANGDNQVFGRLFDDRANEAQLNQAAIQVERPLIAGTQDASGKCLKSASEFDWGFKFVGFFGSDARYTHSLGLGDQYGTASHQADLAEAYVSLHLPVLTEGGMGVKVGKFMTMEGAETVDPRTNFFYSHTFLINFAVPLTHTGFLTTTHLGNGFDLCAGATRGVNTSLDDNNKSLGFHGGLCWTGEKWSILATTHVGPENLNSNDDYRSLSDVVVTFKASDKLTLTTDLNYTEDQTFGKCYGVVQYATYAISSKLSVGVRAEVFRDQDGFYAASFAANDDLMNGFNGQPFTDPLTRGGGKTTYGALTLGANIKFDAPKGFSGLVLRPEVRYDTALNDSTPFNDGASSEQFTLGVDAVLTF